MSDAYRSLLRLAGTVLSPGFEGTDPPSWLLRLLGEGLGGVTLYDRNVRTPEQVAALTAALRAERPEVVVGVDEEAGDVTRLEVRTGSTRPGNLALGAVDDPALTERVAGDLGHDLAAAGVTLDYAPDADINANADNPVIGVRAFGSDPGLVARHTAAFIRGLQGVGVAACAKHFPGHGDTAVDSHHDIPRIEGGRERLDAGELVPFRAAIDAGVQAVMTGHLLVPALDPDLPATLSHRILTGLLREEMGFQGLVVTDGIEMAAVTDRYGLVGATVAALAAGADSVCVGGGQADEATARRLRTAVADAVVDGSLPEERLVEAAMRVDRLAAWTTKQREARRGPAGDAGVGPASDAGVGPAGDAGVGPVGDGGVGLAAARRALRMTGSPVGTLPLAAPPHVAEFVAEVNLAAGDRTPWGVAEPLAAALAGTTTVRLHPGEAGPAEVAARVLGPAGGRPLLLVVRDAHRHPWVLAAVRHALAERPDAIVVELGVPALVLGRVHLATYGASLACASAAVEVLTGRAG